MEHDSRLLGQCKGSAAEPPKSPRRVGFAESSVRMCQPFGMEPAKRTYDVRLRSLGLPTHRAGRTQSNGRWTQPYCLSSSGRGPDQDCHYRSVSEGVLVRIKAENLPVLIEAEERTRSNNHYRGALAEWGRDKPTIVASTTGPTLAEALFQTWPLEAL